MGGLSREAAPRVMRRGGMMPARGRRSAAGAALGSRAGADHRVARRRVGGPASHGHGAALQRRRTSSSHSGLGALLRVQGGAQGTERRPTRYPSAVHGPACFSAGRRSAGVCKGGRPAGAAPRPAVPTATAWPTPERRELTRSSCSSGACASSSVPGAAAAGPPPGLVSSTLHTARDSIATLSRMESVIAASSLELAPWRCGIAAGPASGLVR